MMYVRGTEFIMNASEPLAGDVSLLLVNHEGIVLDAHEAACAALGWTREEIVNKEMTELFEYGADLVLGRFAEASAGTVEAGAAGEFSVSALVRRRDQTHFPATAVVRHLPELNCFAVTFDDLPVDVPEAAPLVAANGNEVGVEVEGSGEVGETAAETEMAIESFDFRKASVSGGNDAPVAEPAVAETNGNGHANGNGDAPRFRNIFLSERPAAEAQAEVKAEVKAEVVKGGNGAKGKEDVSAALEAERQERKRLEARVVSLNDQLQQLHLQLKNNLEAESIYHKRVTECEEGLRKAEERKAAAEAALQAEEQKREGVAQEFAAFKASSAQRDEAQKAWQREWLSKLETGLRELQESDARFEKEIATRRGIDVNLQMLRQDFCAEAKK